MNTHSFSLSLLTFLSPSFGKALRDWLRLFIGPVEGAESLATPGEKLIKTISGGEM